MCRFRGRRFGEDPSRDDSGDVVQAELNYTQCYLIPQEW